MYGQGGLGQSDTDVLAARDILLGMISDLDPKLAGLPHEASRDARVALAKAKTAFKIGLDRFYRLGDNRRALEDFGGGIAHAQESSRAIWALGAKDRRAAESEAQAVKGASFSYQVEQTIKGAITEPVAVALELVSPELAEALRSNWWVVPIAGGGLLMLLLRR